MPLTAPSSAPDSSRPLGPRLVAARRSKGLTQVTAAEALGVHVTTIANWERGRTTPQFGRIEALATLYGVLISNLVSG